VRGAWAWALLSAGCSAMGLDAIGVECRAGESLELPATNELEDLRGVPDQCQSWVCRADGLGYELKTDKELPCNDQDDDCDGLVDEGARWEVANGKLKRQSVGEGAVSSVAASNQEITVLVADDAIERWDFDESGWVAAPSVLGSSVSYNCGTSEAPTKCSFETAVGRPAPGAMFILGRAHDQSGHDGFGAFHSSLHSPTGFADSPVWVPGEISRDAKLSAWAVHRDECFAVAAWNHAGKLIVERSSCESGTLGEFRRISTLDLESTPVPSEGSAATEIGRAILIATPSIERCEGLSLRQVVANGAATSRWCIPAVGARGVVLEDSGAAQGGPDALLAWVRGEEAALHVTRIVRVDEGLEWQEPVVLGEAVRGGIMITRLPTTSSQTAPRWFVAWRSSDRPACLRAAVLASPLKGAKLALNSEPYDTGFCPGRDAEAITVRTLPSGSKLYVAAHEGSTLLGAVLRCGGAAQ
jgi:hypothetical protein